MTLEPCPVDIRSTSSLHSLLLTSFAPSTIPRLSLLAHSHLARISCRRATSMEARSGDALSGEAPYWRFLRVALAALFAPSILCLREENDSDEAKEGSLCL